MVFKGRFFSFSSSKKSSDPSTPETSITPKTSISIPPSGKKNPTKSPKYEPQIEFPFHAIPKQQQQQQQKNDPSTPETSSSPKSPIPNPPSDNKNPTKSPKDEPQSGVHEFPFQTIPKQQQKKSSDKQKKKDGDENGGEVQLGSSSSHLKKTQKGSSDLGLGLRKIKTRSGPLPQESFFDFYDGDEGWVLKVGSFDGCSSSSGRNSGKKKVAQSLSKRALPCSVDDDERKYEMCGGSSDQSASFQNIGELGDSNLQGHSEGQRSFGVFIPDAQDFESPRFQALLRATSAPGKRFPGDKKSFSHELNSKGVKPFPFWKPHGLYNLEEVLVVIREKFDKAKEEVNSELAVFAAELVGILEKNAEVHPEWKETIEDLLVLAQRCSDLKPSEFWVLCEGIVQDLDDQRQELPMGMLKQLHTRMLFTLTRCTRLLQFHKESGLAEDEHLIGLLQSRNLHSADKQVPLGTRRHLEIFDTEMSSKMTNRRKSYGQERHGLSWKREQVIQATYVSPLPADVETAKKFELSASRNSKASWKGLSSPTEKSLKEVRQVKDETYDKGDYLKTLNDNKERSDADQLAIKGPEYPPARELLQQSSTLPKLQLKLSVYWGEQHNVYEENSIICRICEEEIPTSYVEDHSRICTIAYRCDQKGLSVNERLIRIAETLEKMVNSYSAKELLNAMESPDALKISKPSAAQEFDTFSPRRSDWSHGGSEDTLDCLPEADSSVFVDDLKGMPSFLCKTNSSQKSDQDMATSSAGCMTPRSPLLTPSVTKMDLLWAGRGAFFEHEDLPQINDLAVIARCMAKCMDQEPLPYLITCLENLQLVIRHRKLVALTVETFGARIEKLLREKYVQICGPVDDDKFDTTSTIFDEDGPSEDDMVHSLFTSPIHSPKDRTSIDDFEIIKPISRGAFGRVFLAKKRKTGDLFAIKVLKKADMIRKNAVKSVLAERDILISVCNPFVVRLFYSFTCEENLYLVMEYLNGGDLFSLLRNLNCLDEDVARTYIAEIVLALEYLHSMHVVHRDLKPDNLLIAHDGHIKLTDFGLSKVGLINSTDDLSGPAVCGTSSLGEETDSEVHQQERRLKRSAVGTPDYLAPEILLGIAHGTTADWWAVGVILFEMVVGIPPFSADHPQAIFNNILNREIHWPLIPEEMSYEAHDLIDKLLTEDPIKRLGAKGATEVKQHVFFKNINWDTLSRQKAAFVPASDNALDTSYFISRFSWNTSDQHVHSASELEDFSDNGSTIDCGSCISNHRQDEQRGDECGGPTEFEPGSASKYSFSNFSFKNLSQLASINYDLLSKGWKDDPRSELDP